MSDSGDDRTRQERDAWRKSGRPLAVGDKVQVNTPGEVCGRIGTIIATPEITRLVNRWFVSFDGSENPAGAYKTFDLERVSVIQPESAERIKILETDLAHWQHKAQCEAAELERLKAASAVTLRDHFAGLAMSGWLANTELGGFEDHYIAGKAYQIADAMLKARA